MHKLVQGFDDLASTLPPTDHHTHPVNVVKKTLQSVEDKACSNLLFDVHKAVVFFQLSLLSFCLLEASRKTVLNDAEPVREQIEH